MVLASFLSLSPIQHSHYNLIIAAKMQTLVLSLCQNPYNDSSIAFRVMPKCLNLRRFWAPHQPSLVAPCHPHLCSSVRRYLQLPEQHVLSCLWVRGNTPHAWNILLLLFSYMQPRGHIRLPLGSPFYPTLEESLFLPMFSLVVTLLVIQLPQVDNEYSEDRACVPLTCVPGTCYPHIYLLNEMRSGF